MRLEAIAEPSSSPQRCARRFDVIKPFLRKGGIGAEIGVFKGAFVDYFLSSEPKKLYLVDPWFRLSAKWAWAQAGQSTVRALVDILTEFEPEISAGQIEPRVEFSRDFLHSFPNDHFDWIYIDSSHSYEGTLEELGVAIHAVKNDGFIIGDDFNPDPNSKHYGVCKAVEEFEAEGHLEILVRGENSQFVARPTPHRKP